MAVTFDPELVADAPSAPSVTRVEPVVPRGLPAPLPRGEQLLWQGAPDRATFARQVFHTRAVALYFTGAAAWQWAIADGDGPQRVAVVALAALVTLGILHAMAWLASRTTVYTVTSARVVMRIGSALPKTIDVPFGIVEGVGLKVRGDGTGQNTGDVMLDLGVESKVAYALLWPHARPWRWRDPQPMLRAVPDAERVGRMLAQRAAAATPSCEYDTPAPEDRFELVDEFKTTAPRPLVLGMVALALSSVLIAGWARWSGNAVGGDYGEPVRQVALRFVDADPDTDPSGEAFDLVGADGAVIASVAPGREGLLRNARRAFETRRARAAVTSDEPLQLTTWSSGLLSLHDPETGQNVRLDFFGRAPEGPLRTLHELAGHRLAESAAAAPTAAE